MSRRYWILPEDTAGQVFSVVAESVDWAGQMVRVAFIRGKREDAQRYIHEVTLRQRGEYQVPSERHHER